MPKKEKMKVEKEIARLNKLMGGFKEMINLPGALFIVDPCKEKIALAEARKVGVPVVAMVDTDCDPTNIDYPVPSNDDAIKAIKFICNMIANAVLQGKMLKETGEMGVIEPQQAEKVPDGSLTEPYTFTPEKNN
jgi:small subunit ribosomal protein S2